MIVSMFAMVFAANVSLTWGLILMTTTSLTLGPVLGMIMLSVDENDGLRALQLTVVITFGAGVVGLYSGIDFSVLGIFLFFALLALLSLRIVMLFTNFASASVATSQSPVLCCLLFSCSTILIDLPP